MKRLSQKEGIAVSVGIIVVMLFSGIVASNLSGSYATFTVPLQAEDEPNINQVSSEAILDFDTEDIVVGDGPVADFGDTAFVHYVGMFEDGEVFDLSTDQPRPIPVELGAGNVITGWELGLAGMREGGTRRLTVPSELAYGKQGVYDRAGHMIIPGNATLIFDVVLLHVNKKGSR